MAALRDKLAERVQPHLEPGEQLRQVFQAQTGPSPYWVVLTYLTMFWNRYVVVAVTDRSIVTFRASALKPAALKSPPQAERHDRRRTFGPVKGIWGKFELDGRRYWVHKRFHKDVAAADAEVGYFGGAGPAVGHAQPGAPGAQPAVGAGGAAIPPIPAAAVATPTAAAAPAGWYPDPHGVAAQRYWDGATWTQHTA
jgi:hypothetical protein